MEEIKPSEANSALMGGIGLTAALSGVLSGGPKTETIDNVTALSEEDDHEYNAEEDFRKVGMEMKEMLLDGLEINDELYVKMYIAKLRMAYEYKDP